MDLRWGEDYDVLADVARTVFAKDSPLTDREKVVTFSDRLRQLVRLDWLQLGNPSGASDSATDLASMAGIFVEMGYSLSPSPLPPLSTARDIALLVGTARGESLAAGIGDGAGVVLPVLTDNGWGTQPVTLRGGSLSGTVLAVLYADEAHSFLVQAVDETGNTVIVVLGVEVVEFEPMPNLGEHPMFTVSFADVALAPEDVLLRGAEADRALAVAQRRAAVLLAAQVCGAGTRLLEMTVGFAKERHQFGGPIGRFQAVQYLCTDIAIGVHLTSAFVRNAAHAVEADVDADLHVALMRKQAARTAQEMVHAAHEVHAGLGFMVESNVHLFTKAARKWQFDLGDDHTHDRSIVFWWKRSQPEARA